VKISVAAKGTHKELVLVGTNHRDPDGTTKLVRLLTRESPSIVAVEVSPYGLYYRHRNGRSLERRFKGAVGHLSERLGVSWRRWGQLLAIHSQLKMPFEYRSALRYCRDTGGSLVCLDESSWSKRWIHEHWQQLLSRENVAVLLRQEPENLLQGVKGDYSLAERLVHCEKPELVSAFVREWLVDQDWEKREARLATKLVRLYGQLGEGRLVYVGGWQHLLSPTGVDTLYDRVRHLKPRRLLLHDGWEEGLR
jgi:hypothetical protein